MNILIPLGGIGSRFQKDGYIQPKPLINVLGNEMITWVIDHLNINADVQIIIVYNKDLTKWNFEEFIYTKYDNVKLIPLDKPTRGAAETVLYGLSHLTDTELKQKTILLDGDTFYLEDIITIFQEKDSNMVFTFTDKQDKPIYSYVSVESGFVTNIKEKDKISTIANTGAYCFKKGSDISKYATLLINNNMTQKGEFYTSGIIDLMLRDKHLFRYHIIPDYKFYCLGTPQQVKIFCQHYEQIPQKRFCFDSSTLLHIDTLNEYKPNHKMINYLQFLKRMGHNIIVYTSEGMKQFNNNIGLVNSVHSKEILSQLEKHRVPYDEIYFGKPHADFYIDGLAVNPMFDLDKYIGFYQTHIKERYFNSVKNSQITTIIKKNNEGGLKGEIYWYLNIPYQIIDLFPKMFNYDLNGTFHELEKIRGITLSYLYVHESLQEKVFHNFLEQIHKIHTLPIPETEKRKNHNHIYYNYTNKIKDRYNEYFSYYQTFPNVEQYYQEITNFLEKYEKNDEGQLSIIHGDPVFTNVMINELDRIKLIDMRGKQGDILTITGDMWYDYAKIYQSLQGYDEIYLGKMVSQSYKDKFIKQFNKFVIETFALSHIKHINILTASLLFSLLPLHQDSKCIKYYELMIRLLEEN